MGVEKLSLRSYSEGLMGYRKISRPLRSDETSVVFLMVCMAHIGSRIVDILVVITEAFHQYQNFDTASWSV